MSHSEICSTRGVSNLLLLLEAILMINLTLRRNAPKSDATQGTSDHHENPSPKKGKGAA